MLINVIIGFLLPWIIGCYFLRKDLSLVVIIGPLASVIAFAFNEVGYQLKWWNVIPTNAGVISFLPYNFGIFPVIACLLIFSVKRSSLNPILLILLFTVLKTLLESLLVLVGIVNYDNGWNLAWTCVSYVLACALTYGGYLIIKSKSLLHDL